MLYSKLRRLIALVAVSVLFIAGCSSDDEPGSSNAVDPVENTDGGDDSSPDGDEGDPESEGDSALIRDASGLIACDIATKALVEAASGIVVTQEEITAESNCNYSADDGGRVRFTIGERAPFDIAELVEGDLADNAGVGAEVQTLDIAGYEGGSGYTLTDDFGDSYDSVTLYVGDLQVSVTLENTTAASPEDFAAPILEALKK